MTTRWLLDTSALPALRDDEDGAQQVAQTAPPSPPPEPAAAQVGEALEERMLTGGWPEALHRSSETRRQAWAHRYLNAILQRDVRDIADV
jgi:predicted AAA+ superfamily ATPase